MIWVYHPPSSRIPGQGWRLARRFPNNWGSWYRSNRNFELRSPKLNETWNEIYHVSINLFKGTIQNCLCKYIYICMFTLTGFWNVSIYTHSIKMKDPPHSDLDPGSSRHLCGVVLLQRFGTLRSLSMSVQCLPQRDGPGWDAGSFGLDLPSFEDLVPTKLAKCWSFNWKCWKI